MDKINIARRPAKPKPQIHYHLYTRKNPILKQELLTDNIDLLNESYFNSSWPTRFLIAGWMNVHNSCPITTIRDAYLLKGEYNVITVSWDETSCDVDYIYLSLSIDLVAKEFAPFVRFLNLSKKVPYSDMYVIGYSLGAQIAGSAGKQLYPNKFNTIFALEPAGPMFSGLGVNQTVDRSDAEYVESIQTNSGILGYFGEAGTASFYPNYGTYQPSCAPTAFGCNHALAYKYFAESILAENVDRQFLGVRCRSFSQLTLLNSCNCKFKRNCEYSKMGGDPSTPKTGVYFLKTNSEFPHAKGLDESLSTS